MIDICKICNEKHDLRTHLKVHGITSKEYYDRFIKKPDEGICPVCGKETKFLGKKIKRSQIKNFKNPTQYISDTKDTTNSKSLWGGEKPLELNEVTLNINTDIL